MIGWLNRRRQQRRAERAAKWWKLDHRSREVPEGRFRLVRLTDDPWCSFIGTRPWCDGVRRPCFCGDECCTCRHTEQHQSGDPS